MTALKLYKIAASAQDFMRTRPTIRERQDIYDCICKIAHKVRPYRPADGITRIAPGYFRYDVKGYEIDFEDVNDGYVTVAVIKYKA